MEFALTFFLCLPGNSRHNCEKPIYREFGDVFEVLNLADAPTPVNLMEGYRKVNHAPRVAALTLFPGKPTCEDSLKRNREYRGLICRKMVLEGWRVEELDDLFERNEHLFNCWEALEDAHDAMNRNCVVGTRRKLNRLLRLLGEEDFHAGRMPAATALEE